MVTLPIKAPILSLVITPFFSILCLAATSNDMRLVDAVKNNDKAATRSLLKAGANANASRPDGATALSWAAHWNNLETVDLLIRAGANVNAANDLGVTPLWESCNNGNATMVEKLAGGRGGCQRNPPGYRRGGANEVRANTGSADAVKSLLAYKANVNAKEKQKGQTALMWAIDERHPEAARVLIEGGADVHARSNGGFTPLLFAARRGDLGSASLMVEKGADVNEAWSGQKARPKATGTANNEADATHEAGLSVLLLATDCGQEAFAIFLVEKRREC